MHAHMLVHACTDVSANKDTRPQLCMHIDAHTHLQRRVINHTHAMCDVKAIVEDDEDAEFQKLAVLLIHARTNACTRARKHA